MDDDKPAAAELRRIAVVGGGVSGLAAAHRLLELSTESKTPIALTVFESSEHVGGIAATRRIDDYLVETGPDSFITNKPALVRLCDRLGIGDWLIPTSTDFRGSLVLRKGRPEPVPEGFMLLSPAKVRPVLASSIFSPLGKLRMGLEVLLPRGPEQHDESLADFVRRRFGREALERLIQPLVGGIYTSDPEKLSLKATLPRFIDMEREHRSLILASRRQAREQSTAETDGSGARYGLFATFRDGIGSFLQFLHERVAERATLRLGEPVTSIATGPDQRVTLTTERESDVFDSVVLTAPAYAAARLLRDGDQQRGGSSSAVEELAGLLSGIEYASTAIVCTGHQLSDCRHPLDSFGLVIPAIEQRRILAASFTSRKFPGRAPDGSVLIRTFIGGAMQPEMLSHSDDQLRQIVVEELEQILGISGTPEFAEVCRHDNSMPQYHVGHLDRVARIFDLAKELPGIELAGNAYYGVGLPDCVQSGELAAERVLEADS